MTIAWSRVYSALINSTSAWRDVSDAHDIETHAYGSHPEEYLDVLASAGDNAKSIPVLFIHGGGWTMGQKESYSDDLTPLRAAGHTVFNVEYPKAPDHPHPHILRSVFAALTWIKREQNVRKIHLIGDSAGGTLAVMAALIATNPELREPLEPLPLQNELPQIVSVSSLYGVLDRQSCFDQNIPGGSAMIAAYGGQPALAETVDAAHAITPADVSFQSHPPCFIGVGSEDVLRQSSEAYQRRLTRMGLNPVFKIYEGASHGFFNTPHDRQRESLQADIIEFLAGCETG